MKSTPVQNSRQDWQVIPKSVAFAALSMVLLSQDMIAQTPLPARAAPSLGPMGILGTNTTVPNSIITWGGWSLSANTCTEEARVLRCAVHIGKGDNEPGSICVSHAALHFSATDSVAAALRASDEKAPESSTVSVCLKLKAHSVQTLTAVFPNSAARKPLGVSVMLEERSQAAPSNVLYKTRAKAPLIAPTP